jgi:hypothetical protein
MFLGPKLMEPKVLGKHFFLKKKKKKKKEKEKKSIMHCSIYLKSKVKILLHQKQRVIKKI